MQSICWFMIHFDPSTDSCFCHLFQKLDAWAKFYPGWSQVSLGWQPTCSLGTTKTCFNLRVLGKVQLFVLALWWTTLTHTIAENKKDSMFVACIGKIPKVWLPKFSFVCGRRGTSDSPGESWFLVKLTYVFMDSSLDSHHRHQGNLLKAITFSPEWQELLSGCLKIWICSFLISVDNMVLRAHVYPSLQKVFVQSSMKLFNVHWC